MKCLLAKYVSVASLVVGITVVGAAEPISFNRDIQPIFAEHCLQCHGPDAEQRAADLRLDMEASAKESAIVAGEPIESELLSRITSTDPDERMPPSQFDALSQGQIEAIRDWIASGAKYERHWALKPIQDAQVPLTEAGEAPSDIDKFVVSKLS